MAELTLPTSGGGTIDLCALGPGRTVIYLYPLTGRPSVDLPEGWDAIPGARGCSTEARNFRDHFQQLRDSGAERVFGFSSQDPAYQAEVVERLRLPFSMISDEHLELADALGLPTFAAPGHERLYARVTLVIRDGAVEHAFYPVFPRYFLRDPSSERAGRRRSAGSGMIVASHTTQLQPSPLDKRHRGTPPNKHARQVLDWLKCNPAEPTDSSHEITASQEHS